ncbi:hypothetical protein V5799_009811 [Amblyomma americanum]|uniref:Secreted protein n=1 Tax=Amblyomma americanum TaxID=6943 RepID=A0AAQ4FAN2_AMBAM
MLKILVVVFLLAIVVSGHNDDIDADYDNDEDTTTTEGSGSPTRPTALPRLPPRGGSGRDFEQIPMERKDLSKS